MAAPTDAERAAADQVLARYPEFRREQLLPLLREVQSATGWLSEELTRYLSQRLDVPFSDLYGVISFYALLKTEPTGRTVMRLCRGVPCMLRGARALGQRFQETMGVGPGEMAPESQLSWEWFACLGQCDHAPALLNGEEAVCDVTPAMVDRLVKEARHASRNS